MKNDDVRCSSQTPQHVLLSHLFRDIRLDARIHQIELVIIRKHLKFVHVLHAAQREGDRHVVARGRTVPSEILPRAAPCRNVSESTGLLEGIGAFRQELMAARVIEEDAKVVQLPVGAH